MAQKGAAEAAEPIAPAEFANLMTAVGPFESNPHIAVACSGGADSLALSLLLHEWAAGRNARITALTVDHRLRPESASEARRVRSWLRQRGMRHCVLVRPEGPLNGNLQAAARRVRYDLMTSWCEAHGVLHLALAHHRDDQAETLLLRLARGSGVDGLAGMATISETSSMRYLRPLLDIPGARLRATLRERRQHHVDDPSNVDDAFRRVRLRKAAPILAEEGLTAERLAATARSMARARDALQHQTSECLAACATLYPEGYCRVEEDILLAAPEEIALRALSRLVTCVGGREYPPRLQRLARLYGALTAPDGLRGGRTLSGCRILRWRGSLLICREARAATETCALDGMLRWDGRFRIDSAAPAGLRVRRLGQAGWRAARARQGDLDGAHVPPAVRPSLPAFWDLDDVAYIPHLKYVRPGLERPENAIREVIFAPVRPLTDAEFEFGVRSANLRPAARVPLAGRNM